MQHGKKETPFHNNAQLPSVTSLAEPIAVKRNWNTISRLNRKPSSRASEPVLREGLGPGLLSPVFAFGRLLSRHNVLVAIIEPDDWRVPREVHLIRQIVVRTCTLGALSVLDVLLREL